MVRPFESEKNRAESAKIWFYFKPAIDSTILKQEVIMYEVVVIKMMRR